MDYLCDEDILIYLSDNMHVEIIGNRIEGDLNKLIWNDLDKISNAVINICNAIGVKAEAVSYYSLNKNYVRVGKRITLISNEKNVDVKPILTTFLSRITKSDHYSNDLFNQNLTPYDELVKKEACDFLLHNSNKPIRHGLEVKAGDSLIKMVGRFGKFEIPDQNLDDPLETLTAVVDGLIKHNRSVHLKLASQKIIVAYFNQIDFLQLHHLMKSAELHLFTMQNKCDAGGKKDMYLLEIKKDSEQFFNV